MSNIAPADIVELLQSYNEEYENSNLPSSKSIGFYNKKIHYPTTISQSYIGHFTNLNKPQLLLNRICALQIYELNEESHQLSEIEFSLIPEQIKYLIPITLENTTELDLLLIITSDFKIQLKQWDGILFHNLVDFDKRKHMVWINNEDEKEKLKFVDVKTSTVHKIYKNQNTVISILMTVHWANKIACVLNIKKIHDFISSWNIDVIPVIHSYEECQICDAIIINQMTTERNIHVILKIHGKEFLHNGYMLHFGNLNLHENEEEASYYTFEEKLLCILKSKNEILIPIVQELSLCPNAEMLIANIKMIVNGGVLSINNENIYYYGHIKDEQDANKFHITKWQLDSDPVMYGEISSNQWIIATNQSLYYFGIINNMPIWYKIKLDNDYWILEASSISILNNEDENVPSFVIITSVSSDTFILNTHLDKKEKWKELDMKILINNIGNIRDMIAFKENEEIEENTLIICCGKFPTGSIKKAKLAYGLETIHEHDIILQTGIELFSFKKCILDKYDSYLCFTDDVMMYSDVMSIIDANYFVNFPGLDKQSYTVYIQCFIFDYIIQITSHSIRIINNDKMIKSIKKLEERISNGMAYGDNIIITSRNKCIYFKYENDIIEMLNEIELENEISAMIHFDLNGNFKLFLGHWMKKEITILDINDINDINGKIENHALLDAMIGQVSSLAIQEQNDTNYILYIGTTDGTVCINKFKIINNNLIFDDYFDFVHIGLTNVKLHLNQNDVIASCDQVAIFEILNEIKISRIYLGINKCNYFIPINSPLFQNGIAWITNKNELKFATLDRTLKLRMSSVAIMDTPLCCQYDEKTKLLIILAETITVTIEEEQKVKQILYFLNSDNLENVLSVELNTDIKFRGLLIGELPSSSAMEFDGMRFKENSNIKMNSYIILWGDTTNNTTYAHGSKKGCMSVFNIEIEVVDGNISYILKNQGLALFDKIPNCFKILPVNLNVEEWKEDIITNDKNEEIKELSGIIDLKAILDDNNIKLKEMEIEVKWNWHWPMIMLGCHDGLYLYRIFVNDGFNELNKAKMRDLMDIEKRDKDKLSSVIKDKLLNGNNIITEEFDCMATEIPVTDITLFYNNKYVIVNLLLSSFMLIKLDLLSKMFKKYKFLNSMLNSNDLMLNTINLSVGYINDCSIMVPVDENDYYIISVNMDKIDKMLIKIKNRFKELNLETDYEYYKDFLKIMIDSFINSSNNNITDDNLNTISELNNSIALYQSINGFCNNIKLGLNKKQDNVIYYSATGTIGIVKEILSDEIKVNEIESLISKNKIIKLNEFMPCLMKKENNSKFYYDMNAIEKIIEILNKKYNINDIFELKLKIDNI